MDASCTIQDNIHLYKLNIYVSRILGTHQNHDFRVTPSFLLNIDILFSYTQKHIYDIILNCIL